MRRETLSKSERLCSDRRIDALFTGGRRGTVSPLRFCWTVEAVTEAAGATAAGAMVETEGVKTEAEVGAVTEAAGVKAAAGSEAAVTVADLVAHRPQAAVSVLFSVPKKAFKKAWTRNLLKRRMRESYRRRKHDLVAAAQETGRHIDIALICLPAAQPPDFTAIDNAIARILEKILARS